MTRRFQIIGVIFLTLFVGLGFAMAADSKSPNAVLVVQGKILDSAGNPLGEATILPHGDQDFGGGPGVSVTIAVSVIPILFVYPFLQKYYTKGILVGSIKG